MATIRLTPAFVVEWNRIRAKVDGLRFAEGMGGKNDPDAIVVGPHLGPDKAPPPPDPDETYLVQVNDVSSDVVASGVYDGTILSGTVTDSGSANGSNLPKNLGTKGADCLLLNFYEMGTTESGGSNPINLLQNGDVYCCKMIGWQDSSGGDAAGKPVMGVFAPPTGVTFAVTVTKTTGSDGTSSTACGYFYKITTLMGAEVGMNLSPDMQRPLGSTKPAQNGLAYLSTSGNIKLLWVDEVPNFTACTS